MRSITVACLLLLVASCSSSADVSETANYAPVATADQPAAVASPAPRADSAGPDPETADPETAPVEQLDRIVATFDDFLSLRAQAITRGIEIDQLSAVATPAAMEQVAALRSVNDDLVARDSYAALDDLAEWSNITTVVPTADGFRFTDCTERQFVTPGGATVVRFVTNDVTMVDDDGTYVVHAVVETQDGSFALTPDEFGCVPPSFAERAEATATLAVSEASRLIADPGAALSRELPPVFSDAARSDLERVLETLNLDGLSRTSDEVVDFTVIGMDVNQAEFTVVVSVCRTYPQGRTFTNSDGEQTITDLAVGSSYEEWLYVLLEPVPSGAPSADTATAIEDRGPNCQEG